MKSTRERLNELREMGHRMALSTPGERMLRGLLIQLCTELIGDQKKVHLDLENSGAMFPPPEVYHVPPAVQYQAGGTIPAPGPPATTIGRPLAEIQRPRSIDAAAAAAAARRSGAPLTIARDPAPETNATDDQETDDLIARLQSDLAAEEQADNGNKGA